MVIIIIIVMIIFILIIIIVINIILKEIIWGWKFNERKPRNVENWHKT